MGEDARALKNGHPLWLASENVCVLQLRQFNYPVLGSMVAHRLQATSSQLPGFVSISPFRIGELGPGFSAGDSGMRIEMTAYEGEHSTAADHGTQVDSSSLAIQVLSDPFEQQNPLPNRELLARLASLSGERVLERPSDLMNLLESRRTTMGAPR